jgi:tRNA(fMet)-specific endonuclease VapC
MGLILDSSVLIQGERAGSSIPAILRQVRGRFGAQPLEISVITIAELTHGLYREKQRERAERRKVFIEAMTSLIPTHDLTTPIAAMVGRIEGEQAAIGIAIAFEDLVIGTTALLLDFAVITTNPKHFNLIPGLTVQTL